MKKLLTIIVIGLASVAGALALTLSSPPADDLDPSSPDSSLACTDNPNRSPHHEDSLGN